jgi:DNA-binding NarL/FixJ family response regulator
VVVVGLHGILREIVMHLLGKQPDIEWVVVNEPAEDLPALVRRKAPEVVVLGQTDDELPRVGVRLLRENPALRVLGIAGDGRHAFVYELRPHREPLGELSPDGLIHAIREAAAAPPA